MSKHHLIITGTGRAGTTLLVQLLTSLGLDTGFTNTTDHVSPYARAGMEFPHDHPNAPYILKTPGFCDFLDDWLRSADVVVDHAIVPMRDLRSAAESRRYVMRATPPEGHINGIVPGGLWNTQDPDMQEFALLASFQSLFLALAKHDIPVTLLDFPRFANDPDYLYRKIQAHLKATTYERFLKAFQHVVNPALIHEFSRS
jgi:hypothetical protein